MVNVTLPDGSVRQFESAVTVSEVAASIGAGLAKAALAGKVDGKLVDTSHRIEADATLAIVTARDADALDLIRHDAAHVMAQAVQELYPGTQVTIGPAIEDGFYYDFARETPFTPEDLVAIEKRMDEIVKRDLPIVREVWEREAAKKTFAAMGEDYKVQIIDDIIAPGEELSVYRQGDWFDMCRGPHLPSTGKLPKAYKLMKLAGAYWRGDSKNPMLQRIYGTAWAKKEDLEAYLFRLEEAEKRDHRKLCKQLDLLHMQEEAPGMVFWHPKGWIVWQQIEQYMRRKFVEYGYQEVRTPAVMDRSLWEKSGHWDNYRDNMFTTSSENRDYAVKPMNCPGHVQIFNSGLHSYRELPLRLAEFGSCHRNEPSGALHGIMRVRGFTQDDAHIFCMEEQVEQEVADFIVMLQKCYADFGFNDVLVKLSTRPEKRVGSDESWDKAETALAAALEKNGLPFDLQPGEGAFYGPKIEFTLKDTLGRLWQCGTIQLDFNLPVRLGAEFVAEDNSRKVPVMLHRAILGSMERFIGILIEHHAGNFPLWLAPVQAMVLNISDKQAAYVSDVVAKLRAAGVRAASDLSNNKITYKIREHSLQKLPYLLVVGDKEMETSTVSVRARGNQELGALNVDDFIARVNAEIQARH
ncbi:MAG: threonine--tRNA ligase [Hydrogenophilales bacterium 16-64-46]|nr:MAG: threonine--tRNA ligase [Hydrogenophilales bacterium 12-64-13]OYZ04704.1 MAG: threonine--tRNA ligase [Hydrogenophilales bacterium 16-64-46]OZA38390.1 MAG: threonine--tRNA ligase [Hydrogenophilales bacterium 17-64-34]HQS99748.1 threonine--tRNA ligase [Thiobacillus sp.]